jgi:hypothetical protein
MAAIATGSDREATSAPDPVTDVIGVATRRVTLLLVAAAAVMLCTTMAAEPSRMSWWWSVALGAAAVAFTLFATRARRRYLSPFLFAIFFTLGYVVVFIQLLSRRENIPPIGFGSLGSFDFTDEAFVPAALAIGGGLLGLATGAKLGELLFPAPGEGTRAQMRPLDVRLVWGWFAVASLVVVVSFYLGVGRTGISNEVVLPARLTGILVIGKTYLIPAVGAILLNVALHRGDRAIVTVLLGQLLVLGVATSVTSLSRGAIVYCVVAPIMFLLSHGRRAPWARWLALRFGAIALVSMVFVVALVADLRRVAFEGRGFSAEQSIEVVRRREDVVDENAVQAFFELAAERTGGMRELLAVTTSTDLHRLGSPAEIFMGDESEIERMTIGVFGFIPESSGSVAFGLGFGLWGMFATSGSTLIVFLGSAVVMFFLVGIEHLFARYGQAGAGFMVSSLVGFRLWGQPLVGEIVRLLFVIAFAHALLWWLVRPQDVAVARLGPQPRRSSMRS